MPRNMAGEGIEARACAALDRLAGQTGALGIALSGGGDSTALMHLAAGWAGTRRLAAATVDHGLRPDSAAEAAATGRAAAALGIPHRVLPWRDHPPGNLMAAAREARLRLLAAWAQAEGLEAVLLGHTADDVAETLLMRLGRGAGIDGLAAMAERRQADGTVWLRPLLGIGRAELRGWLAARGIPFADDPTNSDPRFDRARARAAIAMLGLDPLRLAESARHLDAAREALHRLALDAAEGAEARHGSLLLPRDRFDTAPEELRRILLLAAIRCVTGEAHAPRRDPLTAALAALAAGQRAALGGALLRPQGGTLAVLREPAAALRSPALPADGIWDRRFRIAGLPPGAEIRALGAGAAGLDRGALSRAEAEASPGIWRDSLLLGAPLLAPFPGVTVTPLPSVAGLRAAILAR